jgi:hypothetical protein
MNNHDDEDDGDNQGGNGYAPAVDPFSAAIVLIDLALNPKATKAALKKLAQLDKSISTAEQKLAALAARTEQTNNALAEREAAIAAREVALEEREAVFESQAGAVRDELREHHNRITAAYRQLTHRIMSTAGILGQWNFDLQDPPTWEQLKRMVANLPDDPTPVAEVVSRETREDWVGHTFVPGSTLTRSIIPKPTSQ